MAPNRGEVSIDVGVTLPFSGPLAQANALLEAALLAERLGYSTIWVADHVVTPISSPPDYPYSADGRIDWDPEMPWLEPLALLAFLASATSTVQLGTNVLVVPMRPVLLVAKQLATIDALSSGRLVVGVGVGWSEEEFRLLGQPFSLRGPRVNEAIDVLRGCWAGGRVSHMGDYYQLGEFGFAPARPDGIPIVLGGTSDLALQRVAKKGDGWLPINLDPVALRERLRTLDGMIAAAGRDRKEVRIYAQPGSAGPITRRLADDYAATSVDHLIVEIDWRHDSFDVCLDKMRAVARDLRLERREPPEEATSS